MTGKARYLKKMYEKDEIGENHLDNAVDKGWITEDEKEEIMEQ